MNKTNLYVDDLFADDYKYFLNKNYYSDQKPQIHIVENAIVIPFKSKTENSHQGSGGVINSKEEYIISSQTPQEDLMLPANKYETSKLQHSDDNEVIYLGYFIKQWGHFLVDFMTRLWWLVDNYKGQRIVYLVRNEKTLLDGNYTRMLELFGIPSEKLYPVIEPTSFKKIIIPEMAMVRPDYYTDEYLKIFRKIISNVACSKYPYDKVYFTRKKLLNAKNSEFGEREIENFFRKNGYKVLSPERCTVEKQIAIFHSCSTIVSLSGTIPHNIVFGNSKTNLIIINKVQRINTIQLILNQAVGCTTTYIDGFVALLPVSPGNGPFWLQVNNNLSTFAMDNDMKIPKSSKTEELFTDLYTRRKIQNYFVAYCRNQDEGFDIGGKIVGSSRPLKDGFQVKELYYYYRKRIGSFPTYINFEGFVRWIVKRMLRFN
ncbi:MAG: glycosyltransferase family 61 protein [Chitinispirillaceae bacterium]|nr:glycosyltransferase family 61 protein [Chitinispirillaceae bacterium]